MRGDRIQKTALDVLEGLVDATYTRKRQSILKRVNLGLERLRYLMRLSYDLKYIEMRRYEHAIRKLDEIGRQVGGWLKARARPGPVMMRTAVIICAAISGVRFDPLR